MSESTASYLADMYMSGVISKDQLLAACEVARSSGTNEQRASIRLASGDVGVSYIIDSGSDAHLTSSKSVFVPKSIKKCSVRVFGISGNCISRSFHVSESGSVLMKLSDSENFLLHDVLHVPDAVLSASDPNAVLVSVRKLASESGIDTRFSVNDVIFYLNDDVVGTHTSISDTIYTLTQKENVHTAALAACDNEDIVNNDNENDNDLRKEKLSEVNEEKVKTRKENKKKNGKLKKEKKRRGGSRVGSTLTRKAREKFSRRLHNRIHFGKTQSVRSFLKSVYGDNLIFLDDDVCDACMWSKAKFLPHPTHSHRKAKRVGERLHYDVFTSSYRSDDGCKYLLVIVDEYSGYIWAYGMRRKSETKRLVQLTVRAIEKHVTKKVEHIDAFSEQEVIGVSSLRSDNAGENVLNEMRKWCSNRGTRIETTIPHTSYQDGKAERLGGVVWQGGASFRYGGNLPKTEWLRCCLAYVHVRNRLPTNACKHSTYDTPYEAYNDVNVEAAELIKHFRTIGSICHVVKPHSQRTGKPKRSFRAVLLGYSDGVTGQKGYIVRDLSTGKLSNAAHNQVHAYEFTLAYPQSPDYDAWLNKQTKAIAERDRRMIIDETRNKEMNGLRMLENDASASDDDVDEAEDATNDEASDSENIDDEVIVINEPNNDASDEEVMRRLELGLPISAAPTLPATRSRSAVNADCDSGEGDECDHEVDFPAPAETSSAASTAPLSPPPLSPGPYHRTASVEDSTSDSEDIEVVESDSEEAIERDSDSVESGTSEEMERGEYEVIAITGSRKRGRGLQYQTEWKNGELSWEPQSSFRLESSSSSSSYLPIFTLFKENAKKGIVGARASDCDSEVSDSEDEDDDASHELQISEEESGGSSEAVESGAAVADDPNIGTHATAAAEASVEVGENVSNSNSSSADDSPTVKLEHVALAIRTVRALIALEKAGVKVPQNRREARSGKYWKHFSDAEEGELSSFDELEVWELVEKPHGANVIGTRWVYDVKVNADGTISRFKARLVAQGFSQKEGIDFTDTFAPTMHIKTARVLLTLAARHGIEARLYDVSTAFLHASLKEDVYVKQPPGHEVAGKENHVYKLKKAMYGLKNAPKAYSDHFMSVLRALGFQQSTRDSCLWSLKQGKYFVHYLFHVDDILCVSNHDVLRDICFSKLKSKLRIRDEGPVSKFLGIEISRLSDGSYTMCQEKYIERVAKRFCINDMSRPVDTPGQYGLKLSVRDLPCNDEEESEASKLPYQELVGALLYATKTRPDVAYAVSDVSRFMSRWGMSHYKAALRILRYLYATKDRALIISADAPMELRVYADANYGDERESEKDDVKWKSQGGFLVYLSDTLVSWRSRRHKCRSHSSMESEYMEASEAGKEILFFRMLLEELDYKQTTPSVLYEDNKACISFSKNNTSHDRTKHIDIRAYCLRDYIRDGVIKMLHVDTREQLADMLTKHQLKHLFQDHVNSMFSAFTTPTTARVVKRARSCNCLSCFVNH